jgi:energy-coupling factor transporter ATP-binding protein EcfA2
MNSQAAFSARLATLRQRIINEWNLVPDDQTAADQVANTAQLAALRETQNYNRAVPTVGPSPTHKEQFIAEILRKPLQPSVQQLSPFFHVQSRYRYFFSRNRQIDLPYPSETIPERFKVSQLLPFSQNDFSYFGRKEYFPSLLNAFNRSLESSVPLLVIGNLGSGKSHLLSALALTLHLIRADLDSQAPAVGPSNLINVIYVPSWQEPVGGLYESYIDVLKGAVAYAFPNNQNIEDYDAAALKNFLLSQPDKSMVFILDDWNRICDSPVTDDPNSAENWLSAYLCAFTRKKQFVVRGICASSKLLTSLSTTRFRTITQNVFGGLTDDEFELWQQYEPFNALSAVLTPEHRDDFRAFTGLVPYFIKKMSEYRSDSYDKLVVS